MRKYLFLALLLVCGFKAHAQCVLPANATESQVQTAANTANSGGCASPGTKTVQFSAGTTTWNTGVYLPCQGVTYAGPVMAIHAAEGGMPTAIINGAGVGTSGNMWDFTGCNNLTVEYLWFQHGAPIYVDDSNNNGITILSTLTTSIPDVNTGTQNCCGGPNAFEFGGHVVKPANPGGTYPTEYSGNLTQNVLMQDNWIGSTDSCPNSFATPNGEVNSACTAIQIEAGTARSFHLFNNVIYWVNEGIKPLQINTCAGNGQPHCVITDTSDVTDDLEIMYNYFFHINRISVEIQSQVVNHPVLFEHNYVDESTNNNYYGTLTISLACCSNGFYINYGDVNACQGDPSLKPCPSIFSFDNIGLNAANPSHVPPYFYEYWGSGHQSQYNYIGGYFGQMYTYTINFTNGQSPYAAYPATINYNFLCVPNGWTSSWSGWITPELSSPADAPAQVGNTEQGTGCTTEQSIAPVISPASGTYAGAQTVTMSIPAQPATALIQGTNQSIYYTTDGSTPTVSSTRYTGPITISSNATVKAISQWGVPPQPSSTPYAGYGYVPSGVVSNTYTFSSSGGCLLPANATQSQITAALSLAGAGTCTNTASNQTVQFQTGTSTITAAITIPCNGAVVIAGTSEPNLTAPATILNGSGLSVGQYIFNGASCTGLTIQNLGFNGAGGIYFSNTANSNVSILNNAFTAIPDATSSPNCCSGPAAIKFDGAYAASLSGSGSGTFLQNLDQAIVVKYNTFGDANSCTNSFAAAEQNAACTGIWDNAGEILNGTFEFNRFTHMNEGIKFIGPTASTPGATNPVCVNCLVEFNYFLGTHRIPFEDSASTPNNQTVFAHNAILMDGGLPYASTSGAALACCASGFEQSSSTWPPINPGLTVSDNVIVSTLNPSGTSPAPDGVEFWGAGSQGTYNLVQGYFANPFTWNTNAASGAVINYNYLCWPTGYTGTGFITQQTTNASGPAQTGNITGTPCTAAASASPAISPTPSGTYSAPVTVTLSIPAQPTGNIVQGQNTSIYYTTNGTTPTVTSTLYTGPFSVAAGSTVNAISMWGVPPQPASWPSGYGYTPSATVSATYPSGSGGPTLTGVVVSFTGGGTSVAVGNSIQAIATCTYSDSSTTNCTTTDSHGTLASGWASSVPAFATISTGGLVTAVAAGNTNITVTAGSFTATPRTLSVTTPAQTLRSITLSGASTVTQGSTTPITATCNYGGGLSTNCTTTDQFGNKATQWTSSDPTDASVNTSGVVTGVGTTACSTNTWTLGQMASGATVVSDAITTGAFTVPSGNNVVVVAVTSYMTTPNNGYAPSLALVADNSGNPYSVSPSSPEALTTGWTTNPAAVWMFYKINAPAGSTTVTASGFDATSTGYTVSAIVFTPSSGCGAAFDQDAVAATLSATATPITRPFLTPTNNGELLYGIAVPGTGLNGVGTPWTEGNLMVPEGELDAYVLSSSGPVSANWDTFTSPDVWTGAIEAIYAPTTSGSSGLTTITAQVGNITSLPLPISTTTNSPPVVTLTGVSIACGGSNTLQTGATLACFATCTYSDASTTNCTTTDAHGTLASGWASSNTAAATVASTGVVTGVGVGTTNLTVGAGSFTAPNFPISVTQPPPGNTTLGNNQTGTTGVTYANFINSTYAVTGISTPGYTVQSCSFYLPTGYTYTTGSKWDCGLILAPTATTQSASWLCHATYTTLGTSADVGWHTLGLGSSCGTLPGSTAYWVPVSTNEAGPIGEGFWNCGNATTGCQGTAPTAGQNNGTYKYYYLSVNYGQYTGMGTTLNASCNSSTLCLQGSQYATLTGATPTLTGGYLGNPGPTVTLSINGSVQFYAFCSYSDGTTQPCYPTPSTYGDTVTGWTSSSPSVASVGNVGSSHPGLATGLSVGSTNIQATLGTATGTASTFVWGLNVSTTPQPYPPTTTKSLAAR